jgi:hypothetical protein
MEHRRQYARANRKRAGLGRAHLRRNGIGLALAGVGRGADRRCPLRRCATVLDDVCELVRQGRAAFGAPRRTRARAEYDVVAERKGASADGFRGICSFGAIVNAHVREREIEAGLKLTALAGVERTATLGKSKRLSACLRR